MKVGAALLGLLAIIVMVVMGASPIRDVDYAKMQDANVIVGGNCSGTHIGEGKVLTAWHCVQFLDVGKYTLLTQKRTGEHWDTLLKTFGYVVWKDKDTDLAILEVKDPSIFGVADVCFRDPVLGETVYAFGNPAMQEDTLLKGIVSKVLRKIAIAGTERTYFQVDAGLVGGISGGALYDAGGCLIGVNAAGIPGTVIGGAISVQKLPVDAR